MSPISLSDFLDFKINFNSISLHLNIAINSMKMSHIWYCNVWEQFQVQYIIGINGWRVKTPDCINIPRHAHQVLNSQQPICLFLIFFWYWNCVTDQIYMKTSCTCESLGECGLYLKQPLTPPQCKIIAAYYTSNHTLAIKTRQWSTTPISRDNRLCHFCSYNVVKNE